MHILAHHQQRSGTLCALRSSQPCWFACRHCCTRLRQPPLRADDTRRNLLQQGASPHTTAHSAPPAPWLSAGTLVTNSRTAMRATPDMVRVRDVCGLAAPHQRQFERLGRLLACVSSGTKPVSLLTQHARSPCSEKADSGEGSRAGHVTSCRVELSEIYVACALTVQHASPRTASLALNQSKHDDAARLSVSVTGINHALHRRVNQDGCTLRGILKGCAEQNALGAVAAQGYPYIAISTVYLLSTTMTSPSLPSTPSCPGTGKEVTGGLFPCAECWSHLMQVGRQRRRAGLAALQLFVGVQGAPDAAIALACTRTGVKQQAEWPVEVTLVMM